MTPGGLITLLDTTADECEHMAVPDDPFTPDADALVIAAMRCGYGVLGLAQRILAAQRDLDAQMNRRPYPKPTPAPKPKPPPPPPPKPSK